MKIGKAVRIALLFIGVFSAGYFSFRFQKTIVLEPQKTGIATLRYVDSSRDRPIITEVWYPVAEAVPSKPVAGLWVRCSEARDAPINTAKPLPLVVISHGNGGDRLNVAWLAEILASNGFIVAAMDHHGNTWNHKEVEGTVKIWERPRDVSFVIDQLLQDDRFGKAIDAKRIGFVGYSLGGQTGIWIAGGKISNLSSAILDAISKEQMPKGLSAEVMDQIDLSPAQESYQDNRISACFLMAPALIELFDPDSLASIQVPLYIVAPESDEVVPAEKNGKMLARMAKKAAISIIPGAATHYVFLNEVSKGGKALLDRKIALDPPTVDRREIHLQVAKLAVDFFAEHLPKDS